MSPLTFALSLVVFRTVSGIFDQDPELSPHLFQGDIVQMPNMLRNGINTEIYLWPNRTVLYVIDEEQFGPLHREEIEKGIDFIQNISCIKFQPARAEERNTALHIVSTLKGCSIIHVGFRSSMNVINLEAYDIGKGCFRMGSILHELLHALGFEHQHVAHNRDEYVQIEWDNIKNAYKINFFNNDKTSKYTSFGEQYDYDSVMHYVPNAFTKNGKPTIVPLKDGGFQMGQRITMSEIDIRKLNKMYKCPGYEWT
ncbi:hypothetical protein KR018_007248 [Drosophila ironensis]|nr:hypothetical protein KR018_007248 [Drosophila ironensis]